MNPLVKDVNAKVIRAIKEYPDLLAEERELREALKAKPQGGTTSPPSMNGRPTEQTATQELAPRKKRMLYAVREALRVSRYFGGEPNDYKTIIGLLYGWNSHRKPLTIYQVANETYVGEDTIRKYHANFKALVASQLER